RRTSSASRSRRHPRGTMSATVAKAATVSAFRRPVASVTIAETATAPEPRRSERTSRYAARTVRLALWASRSSAIEIALLARPTAATARTTPLATSEASERRRTPSTSTTLATRKSRPVFSTVARISRRSIPNVRRSLVGRAASHTATTAIASATTSMRTWNASAKSARLLANAAATASTSKSETILAGATGHGGGRVNMDELMRDLNTLADTGKLPDNLPAANATAGPGGMKTRGMAEQKGIKHVIAVMSGKGGVGKSLVAGLLAIGLKRRGFRVGVLDGDITGPSIPRMFGVREKPVSSDGKTLNPPRSRGGIPIMSMNLLLPDEGEAVIWRGPMV